MDPAFIKTTEAALKQHWKTLKIKSNNYPALVRKNVPTKGQDYSIPELGAALLNYANEKGVTSWADLIKLNNSDPWSEISVKVFKSGAYGVVLRKIAHLENAHFDSFLDEQLQKQQTEGERPTGGATNANEPRGGTGHSVDSQRPDPAVTVSSSTPTRSSGNQHARIPQRRMNTAGVGTRSKEGAAGAPNVENDRPSGRPSSERARASPGRSMRNTGTEGGRSEGGDIEGRPRPAASPSGPSETGRQVPDQAPSSPKSPANGTRSETPAPTSDHSTPTTDAPPAAPPSPLTSPPRSPAKAPASDRPSGPGLFMDSPSRNTRSQTSPQHGSVGGGNKRTDEEAFGAEWSGQPYKKGPGSTRNPCPRPGGCPTGSTNHIRKTTCEGCNYDIFSHNAARKKAQENARKGKIPALSVVLKAATRELDKLRQHGCSAALMVQTPKVEKQATQWFFASAGTKGQTFVDKYRGYFKRSMKNEGREEVKVEEGAKVDEKVTGGAEPVAAKATDPVARYALSTDLEYLVKGFVDCYPEAVIETMLTALQKHYIDRDTAKKLDMSALQELFGKNMLGPCLRFQSSVKNL